MSDPTDRPGNRPAPIPEYPEGPQNVDFSEFSDESGRRAKPQALAVRITVGVIGVAVAGATIAAAALLPLPQLLATPAAVSVTPVSTEQQLVCAGPLLRLGDAQGQDASNASAIGSEQLQVGGDVTESSIASSDATDSAPTALTAPAGLDAAAVSGAQSQTLSGEGLGGFAATACTEPTSDTWLVAGSNGVGRTSILTLSNASEVSSTVNLALYGANGEVQAPGATGIVVPAGGQRVFPLAGLMPGEQSPVVRVTSRGGAVTANLQQVTERGLEAGGVDVVGGTASPSDRLLIPGVVITNGAATLENLSREGFADLQTTLRIFTPGEESATVRVGITRDSGDPTGQSFEVDLQAGAVSELPIDNLADGTYTVSVLSSVPVVAGVRASTVGTDTADFAWHNAAPQLDDEVLFSASVGDAPTLFVTNPGDTEVTVTLAADAGSDRPIAVPAGGTASASLTGATSYRLSGADGLHAAVSYSGDGVLASYAVPVPRAASESVTIYP
ncbi:DUF5719 family protein [Diaminobutyricimonas sp. TR449]|uniref:DUF5719 family protein n=1 Tax=Diaminobutyricimonas sp. TR449 TaxID=2708076 RepID=UPI00141F16B2|nr:DUF5719 family protein [Diaminobutyricimonas sp. TR449]